MAGEIVTLPYSPRPFWKDVLHKALSEHRFAVIVAHRRFGKSIGMVNHMIRDAIQCDKISPQYAMIGPYANQMVKIAWEPLKYYTKDIVGRKVNENEKYIEFPTKHAGAAGARIYIMGADKPDRARGMYFDGVILDEYADMKPSMWTKIVRPAIEDRQGYCYFIGTPKGQNSFYELYRKAKRSKRWFTALYDVYHTGIFTPKQIEEIKEDMSDTEFAQEFLCDFAQAAYNDVFSMELLDKAFGKLLNEKDVPEDLPVILGTDIARYGDDRTVIWKRKGLMAFAKPYVYKGLNTMEVADRVIMAINETRAEMNFIDVGNMGAGVVDRVRQMGYHNISEVAFQGRAVDNDRYENIRAEMYFKLKEWIEAGGAIPEEPGLRDELACLKYKFSKHGKIVLTPKDEIKEMLNRSPDLADGLALTFARPVAPRYGQRGRNKERYMCNTEYCVLDSAANDFLGGL